jgi:divinyl chlorophyllide a 8-vinyl-reductase
MVNHLSKERNSSSVIRFLLLLLGSVSSSHRVVVTGASGYIGRSVVRELVQRNVQTLAVVRSSSLSNITASYLQGSTIAVCDVTDPSNVDLVMKDFQPTASICCLASRSGTPKDSWAVDYGAGLNTLKSFECHASGDNPHFVLLSAYCVGKPRLQFQYAKLKLEEEIRRAQVSHSIVRPTAYFKSVDGQLDGVSKGNPILLFGDGSCSSNAIADSDLAKYLCDCIFDRSLLMNGTRDIGGPDVPPVNKRQIAELIFDAVQISNDKRRIIFVPLVLFTIIISLFTTLETICKWVGLKELAENFDNGAEITRIIEYYATEPMVATGAGSVQGNIFLKDHFKRLADRGGALEEIDLMTTTAGVLQSIKNSNTLSS